MGSLAATGWIKTSRVHLETLLHDGLLEGAAHLTALQKTPSSAFNSGTNMELPHWVNQSCASRAESHV
jgi:hypothetical protein